MSKKTIFVVISVCALLWALAMLPKDPLIVKTKSFLDVTDSFSSGGGRKTKFEIRDRVATITDTGFTPRHIPLIMHFHAVLGPDWPIVYYTTNETYNEHLAPEAVNASAIWTRAVKNYNIQVRILPEGKFDLKSRDGVNQYLADPWMWEDLAPAKHVLIFQADAILCANSKHSIEDFLEYDMIGATLRPEGDMWNGGLSLRNRTMILDILRDNDFNKENPPGSDEGEDVWYSGKMIKLGARLPEIDVALSFAVEYNFHMQVPRFPLGYHKIHKRAPSKLKMIAEWCPEIQLSGPGFLGKT